MIDLNIPYVFIHSRTNV